MNLIGWPGFIVTGALSIYVISVVVLGAPTIGRWGLLHLGISWFTMVGFCWRPLPGHLHCDVGFRSTTGSL